MKKTKQREVLLKQNRPGFSLANLLVKMLVQLSSNLNFHFMLQFSVAL